jgi:hypothetical protein
MIKLRETVTDSLSGMKGIAIGRYTYKDGCTRVVMLLPRENDHTPPKTMSVNELRLTENTDEVAPVPEILGQVVRDKLTGYEGTAVVYLEDPYSAPHVIVQAHGVSVLDGMPAGAMDCELSGVEVVEPAGDDLPHPASQTREVGAPAGGPLEAGFSDSD